MNWDTMLTQSPRDNEEREAMVAFHKLEQECDARNCVEALSIRDSGELKKGQVVKINAAIKRWYKETSSAIKRLTPSSSNFIGYSNYSKERTWLCKS
jgi:hypothetical protein